MTIYVWYDGDQGWARLSVVGYLRIRRGESWACKHISLAGGDTIRIVVTGDVHPRAVSEIGRRAERWLIEEGYAVRVPGGIKAVG